jgi:hypothetical protein
MHQPERSKSPLEKWQLGMDRLTRAEGEPDLLGSAMLSIHGALEDQFRQTLASLPQLSAAERLRVQDVSQVQWRELCDLMQKYVGLSDQDVKYIMQMNSMRIKAGHGGQFPGSYQDVAQYTEFVKGWVGSTESTTPQGTRFSFNRCPRCQSMSIKSLEVIYDRGISYVERRRGQAEMRQSGMSLRAAPPQKRKVSSAILWCLVMLLFGCPFLAGIVVSLALVFNNIPLIGGLLAGVVSLIGIAGMFWGSLYPFYRVRKFNETKYPALLEEWRRTFMCEQCGHTFPVNSLG